MLHTNKRIRSNTMDHQMRKCDRDALRQDTTNPLIMKLYNLVDEINLADKKHEGIIPDRILHIMDSDLNGIIRSCEEWLGDHPKKAAGEFLHKLHEEEADHDYVKKVIEAVPEALLHENKRGEIPIQTAACQCSHGDVAKYIPLLATEASRRNIGPERGGILLRPCDSRHKVLEILVRESNRSIPDEGDEMFLQALKDLRSSGLFLDQDIVQYNFIGKTSIKYCLKRLDYLLEICPKALSTPRSINGDFPLHLSNSIYIYGVCCEIRILIFEKLLTVGAEHYPEKLGFLFQPNRQHVLSPFRTPMQQALQSFGKDQTLQIIQNVIPSTEDCPILHHIFQHHPELCEDFVSRYPDAVSCKDAQGRNFLHVAITATNGLKLPDSLLATIGNIQNVTEKDPETNLYPFMLAAASDHDNNLTTVYKLLQFCPDVISWYLE